MWSSARLRSLDMAQSTWGRCVLGRCSRDFRVRNGVDASGVEASEASRRSRCSRRKDQQASERRGVVARLRVPQRAGAPTHTCQYSPRSPPRQGSIPTDSSLTGARFEAQVFSGDDAGLGIDGPAATGCLGERVRQGLLPCGLRRPERRRHGQKAAATEGRLRQWRLPCGLRRAQRRRSSPQVAIGAGHTFSAPSRRRERIRRYRLHPSPVSRLAHPSVPSNATQRGANRIV